MDKLIRSLKAAGSWYKMDALYVFAAHEEQAAKRNWIQDAFNIATSSVATFVANSHFVGNGTSDTLSTSFNPTTGTKKFTLNSAHMAAWSVSDLAIGGSTTSYLVGNTTSYLARGGAAAGSIVSHPNNSTDNTYNSTDTLPGHIGWDRSASNLFEVYANGVDVGGTTTASTSLTSASFQICAAGGTRWGNNEIRFVHFGSSMSAAEWLATYNALNTYAGSL